MYWNGYLLHDHSARPCTCIKDRILVGQKIVVTLKMQAKNYPPVKSRNTVAEIKGSKYPEQVGKLCDERWLNNYYKNRQKITLQ